MILFIGGASLIVELKYSSGLPMREPGRTAAPASVERVRVGKTSSVNSGTRLQTGAAMQVAPLNKSEPSRMDQAKCNPQSSSLRSRTRLRAGRASHVTMYVEPQFSR
jgi:hypothetical protein